MVGIKALFSFLGMLLGLITGLRWGVPQGWLMGMGATAGGAIGGGIGGCLFGWLLGSSSEFIRRVSERLANRHPVLGEVFRWCSLVVMIAALLGFGYLLLCALPGAHR